MLRSHQFSGKTLSIAYMAKGMGKLFPGMLLVSVLWFFSPMVCRAGSSLPVMVQDSIPIGILDTIGVQDSILPSDTLPLPPQEEHNYIHDTLPETLQEVTETEPDTLAPEPDPYPNFSHRFSKDPAPVIHSPMKATMLSAALPGLGQMYNGKYWKVPIIYAGFGTLFYFINFNNTYYQDFRSAYRARMDGNPNTVPDEKFAFYSNDELNRGMNYYRRNLEISYILTAVLYILNVLDATVDAHLLGFDIGEDLTMNFSPGVIQAPLHNTRNTGLMLTLRF